MIVSKLKFISIGVVTEHKERDSHEVPVVPIEYTPAIDGSLMDVIEEIEVGARDRDDVEYTVKLKVGSSIVATWLPEGSNRITPPDIRRGTQVKLWQYADHDRYYWSSMGFDDDLMRLETAVFAYAAEPDPTIELDPALNMYTAEISTHDRHITIHTSQANDEPFQYTIKLDTALGNFHIHDSTGNEWWFDSAERLFRFKNSDDTVIELDKLNINLSCQGILTGYVKEKIDITCDGPFVARAPTMQFGLDDAVQPSVLGDNLAAAFQRIHDWLNAHTHTGNLGVPTSPPLTPLNEASVLASGDSYSTVNTNQ